MKYYERVQSPENKIEEILNKAVVEAVDGFVTIPQADLLVAYDEIEEDFATAKEHLIHLEKMAEDMPMFMHRVELLKTALFTMAEKV